MNSKIQNIETFMRKYFEEIVKLNTKYKLGLGISDLIKNKLPEYHPLHTIFAAILDSLKNDIFITVSKIFEIKFDNLENDLDIAGKRSDCNIIKFLLTVDSLRRQDININEDIQIIKENKIIINNLLTRRDKYYVHFDHEYFFELSKLDVDVKISWDEIKKLIDITNDILNKYSILVFGNEYYCNFTRIDDEIELFKKIFIKYFADIKSSKEKYLSDSKI